MTCHLAHNGRKNEEHRRKTMKIFFSIPTIFVGVFLVCGCSTPQMHEEAAAAKIEPCLPCPCAPEEEKMEPVDPAYAPEVSILGHIAERYEPSTFSHKKHINYAPSCFTCHHRQTEVDKAPPCRACHTLTSKVPGQPGLKVAYHQQCMICHKEKGGPMGCTDCHQAAARPAPVEHAPKVAILYHISAQFEPVKFNHDSHERAAGKCTVCHHYPGEVEKTAPCRNCHRTLESREGDKKLGLKDAYHTQCNLCHGEKAKRPLGCTDCHAPKGKAESTQLVATTSKPISPITATIPAEKETIKLRWKAATMPLVKFRHLKHNRDYGIGCIECHHMGGDDLTCRNCHKGTKGPAGEPTFKNAMHGSCIG